jgi:hypothetical protein
LKSGRLAAFANECLAPGKFFVSIVRTNLLSSNWQQLATAIWGISGESLSWLGLVCAYKTNNNPFPVPGIKYPSLRKYLDSVSVSFQS